MPNFNVKPYLMKDDLPSVPMSTLQERMKMALEHRKKISAPGERVSQAALSRFCDVRGPSVSAWFTGDTLSLEGVNLLNAAKYLKVRSEWLGDGRGPMLYDHSTDEQRSLDDMLLQIDRTAFTPMAIKLAIEFDSIPDYENQLDAFTRCVSIIAMLKGPR